MLEKKNGRIFSIPGSQDDRTHKDCGAQINKVLCSAHEFCLFKKTFEHPHPKSCGFCAQTDRPIR